MGCTCRGMKKSKDGESRKVIRALEKKHQRLSQRRQHTYNFGGPSISGNISCIFDDKYDCYCVENGKRWYLYNDTANANFHVTMRFRKSCFIKKIGKTKLKREGKSLYAKVVVPPLETVRFLYFWRKKFRKPLGTGIKLEMLTEDYEDNEIIDINFSDGSEMDAGISPVPQQLPPQAFMETENVSANKKVQYEANKVRNCSTKASKAEDFLRRCRKKKIMYVDLSFKPDMTSLQRPNDENKVQDVSIITWKRPTDYVLKKRRKYIKLFRNGIDPQDVDQGRLGDCWLVSALSVLAGRPFFVRQIFARPVSKRCLRKEQAVGAYRVSINKNGWWENIILDSYLPTVHNQPWFAKCADDLCELWASLLEKAYAKLHGSYASIIGGDSLLALQDFTGFPVVSFHGVWDRVTEDPEAASNFFKNLQRYQEKGFFITLSTPGVDTTVYTGAAVGKNPKSLVDCYKKAGLVMGHAYSVLDVRQFSVPDVKLIKIRNPWGSGSEWTGAWSDSSKLWKKYPAIGSACCNTDSDDGTFWMDWKEVVKYFEGGGICMARCGWYDYRVKGTFCGQNPGFVLEMSPRKETKVVLVLSQRDTRISAAENGTDAAYKAILISVYGHSKGRKTHFLKANSTLDPEETSAKAFTFSAARDVGLEIVLDPSLSPYVIVPRVMTDTLDESKTDFTLGILTSTKIHPEALRVWFKKVPENYAPLRNTREFTKSENQSLYLKFQRKKPGKVAKLREGICMHCSAKSKSRSTVF